MGEHVGESHDRGLAGAIGVVVGFDHVRDRHRQAPSTSEYPADERVVDAQLSAFALEAVLGRPGVAVDLTRVPRVRVHEHELADVVQERGDHQPVSGLETDLAAIRLAAR